MLSREIVARPVDTGFARYRTRKQDVDNNRVKKVAGSTATYYIGNHYEVTVSVATSVLKYYYFGKQRIALRNSVGVVYLHSDHLGSTSVTSGATSSAQTYYPFGSIRTATGSVPTDFGFTGQRTDASSNLMYYGARYYNSTLGRFISADTIVPSAGNPQSLNRYSYVGNNPIRYTDPDGHCWPVCTTIAGAIIGAGVGFAAYAIDVHVNGKEWDSGQATAVTATGAVAGALIGLGGPAAAVAGLGVTGAAVITSAGAGIALAGGGYIAANTITGQEFNTTDFLVASAVGGATGALGPVGAGTTIARATILNGISSGVQSALSDTLHGEAINWQGVGISTGIGLITGRLGGRYHSPDELSTIRSGLSELQNLRFGAWRDRIIVVTDSMVSAEIRQQLISAFGKNFILVTASELYDPTNPNSTEASMPSSDNP
jgi:RHS repeat-associated protein